MAPVIADRKYPALTFAVGMAAGLLVAAVFIAGLAGTVRKRGITVQVETAPIAAQVEAELRVAMRREVPGALAALRAELPRKVAAQAGARLRESTVTVAGFTVPVPPAAVDQVESAVEQALRSGLTVALTDADVGALADRLSKQAGGAVHDRLGAYLTGRTFQVDIWRGYTVPVRVAPR